MNFRLERCEQPRRLKVTRRRLRPGLASLPEPATSGRTILWPRPTLEVTPPSPRAATRTGRARSSPSTGLRLWWTTWLGRERPCQVFRPLFRTQRYIKQRAVIKSHDVKRIRKTNQQIWSSLQKKLSSRQGKLLIFYFMLFLLNAVI